MNKTEERLRYPIGRYVQIKEALTDELKEQWIKAIEHLPGWVEECIRDIGEDGLDMRYRRDGWTVRQVVHHLADIHMQVYLWLKLALTKDNPIINPQDERILAGFFDATNAPVSHSISILHGITV